MVLETVSDRARIRSWFHRLAIYAVCLRNRLPLHLLHGGLGSNNPAVLDDFRQNHERWKFGQERKARGFYFFLELGSYSDELPNFDCLDLDTVLGLLDNPYLDRAKASAS